MLLEKLYKYMKYIFTYIKKVFYANIINTQEIITSIYLLKNLLKNTKEPLIIIIQKILLFGNIQTVNKKETNLSKKQVPDDFELKNHLN